MDWRRGKFYNSRGIARYTISNKSICQSWRIDWGKPIQAPMKIDSQSFSTKPKRNKMYMNKSTVCLNCFLNRMKLKSGCFLQVTAIWKRKLAIFFTMLMLTRYVGLTVFLMVFNLCSKCAKFFKMCKILYYGKFLLSQKSTNTSKLLPTEMKIYLFSWMWWVVGILT